MTIGAGIAVASVLATVLGIWTTLVGLWVRAAVAHEGAEVRVAIGELCVEVTELRGDMRALAEKVGGIDTRLTRVEGGSAIVVGRP